MEPVDSVGEWIALLVGPPLGLALLVVTVLAVASGPHARGVGGLGNIACGFDRTDPCNWSLVIVRNDTTAAVVLRPCDHHGGAGDQCGPTITVQAGESSPRSQYEGVRAFTGERTWVAVSSGGQRLGCLVLDGHSSKRDGDVVLVSEARRCGDSHTQTTRAAGHVEM